MASLNDIRSTFLDYFARNGHTIVPSGSLVPHNDPTLLFTNAGMVPFKNVFIGAETRDYTCAASSQKCVRAGGKHNDLDNVGYTARHHTFFEMLGNFSFGDYFKEEAIFRAWELVTKVYDIAPGRLLVTVYADDDEAFDLWKKIAGLPEEKIIRIDSSDNFWSMGETGPCGPCSEIFFDHGDHVPGGPPGSKDEDGDRFIEIWNLVFMQYDQVTAERRINLPKPSIDTGMGLERVAALLQGTHDNYQTDLFRHLIEASAEASGVAAEGPHAVSHRVIADHLRACSFLIADGVMPSNEGRGYVLRRIMRRAMRHAHIIGARAPLLWRLLPALILQMGGAYPELRRAEALIREILRHEEERFRQMLARGLTLLDGALADLGAGQALPGAVAFKLYDTYGFPLDLTQDACREKKISVDKAGFEAAMARQRAAARAAWAGSGEAATDAVWFDVKEAVGVTEFLGYGTQSAEGQITALLVDGAQVESVSAGAQAEILTNQTPFYAESGGQVGDTGVLFSSDGAEFLVEDTQKKLGGLHSHKGVLKRGALKVGDVVDMQINAPRRALIRANHSATHLLHAALRHVLGPHVTQKGSQVSAERLRFDFSHPKAVTEEEMKRIEAEVNAVIQQNTEVATHVMTPDTAIEAGALALFGEKYGDEVRVLFMGAPLADQDSRAYSVELCGGTHVVRLGDIALFKVLSESAVASGIRRIEGLTAETARLYLEEQADLARAAADALKVAPSELPARSASLLAERKRLERELGQAKKALALGGGAQGQSASDQVRDVNGIKVLAARLDGAAPKDLRGLADEGKKRLGSGVVAFVAVNEGKAALVVGVTDDLTDSFSAVELVRCGAQSLGGKGGGGRPDMAQAGGPHGDKADVALDAIMQTISERENR